MAAGADLRLEDEADREPERAARHGDERTAQPERQPHAEGKEGHRAAVDVEDVRRDGTDGDPDQCGVAERVPERVREVRRRIGARPVQRADPRADDLEGDAGDEDAERRGEADPLPVDRRGQVAAVVRRVRVPADGVAVGDEEGEDERRRRPAAGRVVRVEPGAVVGLRQDDTDREREHDRQVREHAPLEGVDEVVAEERDADLGGDDEHVADPEPPTEERLEREGAADAVDDEPADAGGEGVQARRQDVPAEAERAARLDELRDPELRAPAREDAVRERAQPCPQHQRERRRPEAAAEERDRDDADEDRRELEVRRHPRPEEVERPSVALVLGDELDPARLDRRDAVAVDTLPDRYACRLGRHRHARHCGETGSVSAAGTRPATVGARNVRPRSERLLGRGARARPMRSWLR